MTFENISQLLGVVAWPVVVFAAILILRKPLSAFLEGLGRRLTKVGVFQFTVELSDVPEAPLEWSKPFLPDVRQPTPASEFSSGAPELLKQMEDDTAFDYAVIDLGAGDRWITSRLFIFAIMLERMRSLRCFVFVETRGDARRRFLGTATPATVRWALALRYPWLEAAYAKAYQKAFEYREDLVQSVYGALPPAVAARVVGTFLQQLQQQTRPSDKKDEWVALKSRQADQRSWERAKWLDRDRLERDLGAYLQKTEDSWVQLSPDTPQAEQTKAVLRREGPFVAQVEDGKSFKRLINRQELVEEVAKSGADAQD